MGQWNGMGGTMKNRAHTYQKSYAKFREKRIQEVIDLKREVRELKQLVEYLCHEVFKDDDVLR